MRIATPFIFFLLLAAVVVLAYNPEPVIGDAPDLSLPVYSACQTDNDCALVAQPCGNIAPARKDRLRELNYYYRHAARQTRCPGAKKDIPAQVALCTASRCVAVTRDSDRKQTP